MVYVILLEFTNCETTTCVALIPRAYPIYHHAIIDRFVTGVPAFLEDTKVTVKACILFIIIVNVKKKEIVYLPF